VLEQFFFGDDAVAMLQEIEQNIERLGFELTRHAGVAQFVDLQIKLIILECINHPSTLLMAGDRLWQPRICESGGAG
jgi:hypothetical protein